MSAILTYFCSFVTPEHAFTKGSCSKHRFGPPCRLARDDRAEAAKTYRDLRPEAKRAEQLGALGCRRRDAMTQSYDKIDGVIWYDGKLTKWSEANCHVLTHGLHYGSCVFEGERAYGGTVFKST